MSGQAAYLDHEDHDDKDNKKEVTPLDEEDVSLMKIYGSGPYDAPIKALEEAVQTKQKLIQELLGVHENDLGRVPPSQWNIHRDLELEAKPFLAVAEVKQIFKKKEIDAKGESVEQNHYVVSLKEFGKYVVNLAEEVSAKDIEEGTRVAVEAPHKLGSTVEIKLVLPPRVDPTVQSMMLAERPNVTYGDIGGCSEQLKQIKEMLELPMLHPERFTQLGIAPPKGVMFYGPPGTGKTLTAKAVARSTEAAFFCIIASMLAQRYVGEGAQIVRNVFERAKQFSAAIIFFDEMDAIGGTRAEAADGADTEVQRTMLEIVNQMDGFDQRESVKCIMATNRPDTLDPALTRPGRVDRKIEFGLPTIKGRAQILRIHCKNLSVERDIRYDLVARMCPSSTGAELRSVCTEAGMFAIKARRKVITEKDVLDAVNKVIKGYKKFSATSMYLMHN